MATDTTTRARPPDGKTQSRKRKEESRSRSEDGRAVADRSGDGWFDEAGTRDGRHPFVQLQRQYGNRTTGRLARGRLQPKLKLRVGRDDDRYEREADRIADAVTDGSSSQPTLQREGAPAVRRLRDDDRTAVGTGDAQTASRSGEVRCRRDPDIGESSPVTADGIEGAFRSSASGRPLPDPVLQTFERRLGTDLDDVRVHTDGRADELNRAVGSRAFTLGRDIYFGAGQYRPGTDAGKWLLAHELTHTVQQTPGKPVVRGDWMPDWLSDAGSAVGEAAVSAGGWVKDRAVGAAEAVGDVAGEVWECAKATGASVSRLVRFDFDSLSDLLGIPEPTGDGPAVISTILAVLQHPCLKMLPGHGLVTGLVSELRPLENFLRGAWRVMQNPDYVVERIWESLGEFVGQIPDRARDIAAGVIGTASEHLSGITRHLEPKIEYLKANWREILKETAWDLVWPWPSVWTDLKRIWGHVKSAASNLWDLQLGDAYDDLLAVWRTANVALGRLYGWFFIGSVLVGTIIGAFFGGVGAIPGAAAGAAVATKVGIGLLVSTVLAETASLQKAAHDLSSEQTEEEQEENYEQIANSGLTLAITGIMFALGAVAARFAKGLIGRVAGRVWQRPARRGRRGTGPSRGDVIEVRVLQSERVLGLLRRRTVTWLETIRRNFPVIDLVDGGVIQVIPRAGRAPIYRVTGGRIISVKSTVQVGQRGVNQIRRWIRELAGFTRRQNVEVNSPTGRTLTVAHRGGLTPQEIAGLRNYAAARGVDLQITSSLPPNQPSVVFVDSIPSILGEAGVVASDEAVNPGQQVPAQPATGESHAQTAE